MPHPEAEDPSEDEKEVLQEFWHGRESIWKTGPQGTPASTPTEVFEVSRRDWHGVGWQAIEVMYSADDQPVGLAAVPAEEIRVRKGSSSPVSVGHGYVQEDDGLTVYYGEAGDRGQRVQMESDESPTYVDRKTGETAEDPNDLKNEPANELLFIPNQHPLTKYYGIPDWVAEVETMMADQSAKEFNRRFFDYDAMPQYAVIVEDGRLTEQSRKSLRELVDRLRKSEDRRMVVLEAEELADYDIDTADGGTPKIRIEPLSSQGEEDMAFTEFRRMNEHDIAKVHEVPHVLINRLESSNKANSRQQIRDFTEEVIKPQQKRFAERIYRVIHQEVLGVDDWTIEFHTKGTDQLTEAELAQTRIAASNGSMYVNEAREELGLEPKDELEGLLLAELNNPKIGDGAPTNAPVQQPPAGEGGNGSSSPFGE
ncbi:phage portal protein [Halorubrum sp. C191]|uniref:phage portal protein n=1 Tax=Halorubrum sp. C191 TaxID=1383842 RepID=UPI0018EC4995|nr:phage portal protein [Halorubrum sp. C191]